MYKRKSKTIILVILNVMASMVTIYKTIKRKERKEIFEKILQYYNIMNQWLRLKQEKVSLVSYFKNRQIKTVAIYGMKELGERLYDELKESEIEVKYVIDQRCDSGNADVVAYSPEDYLPDVDLIVVTASYYFNEIKEKLEKKVKCPIVSVEDIVYMVV